MQRTEAAGGTKRLRIPASTRRPGGNQEAVRVCGRSRRQATNVRHFAARSNRAYSSVKFGSRPVGDVIERGDREKKERAGHDDGQCGDMRQPLCCSIGDFLLRCDDLARSAAPARWPLGRWMVREVTSITSICLHDEDLDIPRSIRIERNVPLVGRPRRM